MEIAIRVYEKRKSEKSGIVTHEEVEEIVEMDEIELIASIVDDSIGYATPLHAKRHVEAYEKGKEKVYCERASAHFNNDLGKLIQSAAKHWYRMGGEKKEKLIDDVERWQKVEEEDEMASQSISMLYPTHSL